MTPSQARAVLEPNDAAVELMRDVIAGLREMVSNTQKFAGDWASVVDLLDQGDWVSAMVRVKEIEKATYYAQESAFKTQKRMRDMAEAHPDLHHATQAAVKRFIILDNIAEMTADELREAVVSHGDPCEDPDCPAIDLMRERLAQLEPH